MYLQLLQFVLGWLTFYHQGKFDVHIFCIFVSLKHCLDVHVYNFDLICDSTQRRCM